MGLGPLTISGLVLLILGIIMVVIGLVLYEQNNRNRKEQPWYVWVMLALGGLLAVVGLVLLIVGITKRRKMSKAIPPTTPTSITSTSITPSYLPYQATTSITPQYQYNPYIAAPNLGSYSLTGTTEKYPSLFGPFY